MSFMHAVPTMSNGLDKLGLQLCNLQDDKETMDFWDHALIKLNYYDWLL